MEQLGYSLMLSCTQCCALSGQKIVRTQTSPWSGKIRDAGLLLLSFVIFFALVSFGAVMPMAFLLSAMSVFFLAVLAGTMLGEPVGTRRLFRFALAFGGIFCVWILIQSSSLAFRGLFHPDWAALDSILPGREGAISLAPANSRYAMLYVAVPVAAFLTALIFCNSDERSMRLLSLLGWIGGILSVFGLVQFLMEPSMLILIEKKAYLDSLTATFVNRNTAATFIGLALLINLSRLRVQAPLLIAFRSRPGFVSQLNLLITLVFILAGLLALLLTKSRAGLASVTLAMLIYVPVVAADWAARSGRSRFRSMMSALLSVAVIFAIIFTFGGRTLLRAHERAIGEDERLCMLPALARALKDYWFTGAGFGNFQITFSPYREASCSIFGTFDRAHSLYLEGWIGSGLAFPILMTLSIIVLLGVYIRGIRKRRRLRHFAVLGLAGILLVLVHGAVDFSLQIPGVALYFAAFVAATTSISLQSSAQARHSDASRQDAKPSVTFVAQSDAAALNLTEGII